MVEKVHLFRSHNCNQLRADHVNDEVKLAGWVHRVRDHGGVLFIDLRDHYGLTQILADPDSPVFSAVENIKQEWCICIEGVVRKREDSLINSKIATGEIEVYIANVSVLGESEELPLPVFGDLSYPEETRLKYRFLDLRKESIHRNMILRSKIIEFIRKEMWKLDFNEFQTPIITSSSPEGARDFLIPSRLHPGKFYALPQAPQIYKQLIMVAGFDKYFQIAPCFRDEDPRSDRSPTDFYQLDVEMSFVSQEDVFQLIEKVFIGLFEEFSDGYKVSADFPIISYSDSLDWYGTDKPDLRNPIKMLDVSSYFEGSGFKIFSDLLKNRENQIKAIPAKAGGSRKFCDRMNKFAQEQGLPGMGYIFWRLTDEKKIEAAGPIAKNLGDQKTEELRGFLNMESGDAVFFFGGNPSHFNDIAAKARNVIGLELGHTVEESYEFCWINDFPMYEKDKETGKVEFSHNPFSMPKDDLFAKELEPLNILGLQYDLSCNGYEILSGAIRNHNIESLFKAFEIAGYKKEEVEERFSGLVNALKFGAPPHGGCAAGIDRIVMLLAKEENIREVIMFPMNQRAEDPMLGSPRLPTDDQLEELKLRVIDEEIV